MRNERLHRMVMIALLGAMAFLLMLAEIQVPPFPPFLKYDPGDVPAAVATYTMGPVAGVWVQGLKALIFWLSGKSADGWVGVLANFLAGVGLVLGIGVVRLVLDRSGLKHWGWGLVAALVGTLVMAAVMIPANGLIIYPAYGMKGAAAWSAALTLSTPFNLFKGFVSSVISLVFYRRLMPYVAGSLAHKPA